MFSAKTEKGPVTPRMVRGWIENLLSLTRQEKTVSTGDRDIQGENDSIQTCTEHNLDRAPAPACQDMQVTGEGNAGQKIREKDVNSTGKDKLVEHCPV